LINGSVCDWCLISGVGYGEPGILADSSKGRMKNGTTRGNRGRKTQGYDG
jgi:hypothetical protein